MSTRKLHEIWIEQCEAAESIKARYGLKAAFDYVVAEKLMNFATAASEHPAFARELPRFVAKVRRMFTPEEIQVHIERIEREQIERDADVTVDDDFVGESPVTIAARSRRFETIKEFLTVPQLGTS
ncbi:MAG: hypothetical protein FJX60_24220 [Alphaproteobacteria bacterium]|nr:hypothetical protein [Alphaproteobacteria bacterium]